ncbi:MAG: hypothetical protein ABSB71_10770 [Candidatus Bathyarchaeia archaeon]|jgi:hypothetical protein
MTAIYKILGYGLASFGVLFLIIAVISKLYSVPTLGTSPSYPYQYLSVPYFFLGLVFLIGGMAGFWIYYLKYERRLKNLQTPLIVPTSKDSEPEAPAPPSPPVSSTMPKAKKESKIEKEVRIVERYYSYSITCPYCRTIYDDKLMQCPKCGGAKP